MTTDETKTPECSDENDDNIIELIVCGVAVGWWFPFLCLSSSSVSSSVSSSSSSFSKYKKNYPYLFQRQYLLVIVVSNEDISQAVAARRTAMTMTTIGLQLCLKAVVVITCDDLHHDMKSIPLIVMMVSYLASLLMMITETTSITTTIITTISKQKRRTHLISVWEAYM